MIKSFKDSNKYVDIPVHSIRLELLDFIWILGRFKLTVIDICKRSDDELCYIIFGNEKDITNFCKFIADLTLIGGC